MAKEGYLLDGDGVKYYPRPSFPIGAVVVTSTNTNPSSEYGGTWKLIDKEFKSQYVWENAERDGYWTPSNNVTSSSFTFAKIGHEITFRLTFTPDAALSDSDCIIGTINLNKLGISRLTQSINQLVGGSDVANCVFLCNLVHSTGEIKVVETIYKSSTSPTIGASHIQFTMPIYYSYMLDSACDKFYWKRTA